MKGTKELLGRLSGVQPYAVLGFGLAAGAAVFEDWSLPEFCWSTWLAAVVYVWACIFTAWVQIMLTARGERAAYLARFPVLHRLPIWAFFALVVLVAAFASLLAFHVYNLMLGFYGIFLSVFAQMEPEEMFGPNGFINSDFYTPIWYLSERYWPMAAGVLLVHWQVFTRPRPWKRLALERTMVRLHVMVLGLPFFSLVAWFLLKENYQTITIVMLMGVLYLIPEHEPADQPEESQDDGSTHQ